MGMCDGNKVNEENNKSNNMANFVWLVEMYVPTFLNQHLYYQLSQLNDLSIPYKITQNNGKFSKGPTPRVATSSLHSFQYENKPIYTSLNSKKTVATFEATR